MVAVLLLYFVGSLSFLVASIAGLAERRRRRGGGERVRLPVRGRLGRLLLRAWVALRMWKREQFGLGFIREINSLPPQTPAAPASPELGRRRRRCPPLWGWRREQSVYLLFGALSSLDVCALAAAAVNDTERAGRVAVAAEIATSVCLFATAHVILLLATDVSRTPPKAPYSYLAGADEAARAALPRVRGAAVGGRVRVTVGVHFQHDHRPIISLYSLSFFASAAFAALPAAPAEVEAALEPLNEIEPPPSASKESKTSSITARDTSKPRTAIAFRNSFLDLAVAVDVPVAGLGAGAAQVRYRAPPPRPRRVRVTTRGRGPSP